MNPRDALKQLAVVCATVPGVAEVHYPAEEVLTATPALNLFWDETEISHGSDQTWAVTVKGQLFAALVQDAQATKSAADGLLAPLVDTFAATPENNAGFHLKAPGIWVDHCRIARLVPSLRIGDYYGAEIYWQIKLHRQPGEG